MRNESSRPIPYLTPSIFARRRVTSSQVPMAPPFLHPPYKYALYAAYAIWALPEMVDASRRDDDHERDLDSNSKYLLYVIIGVVVFADFELGWVAPSWATFGTAAVPLFWLGILLVLVGVTVRWYSVRVLGAAFSRSVTVTESQEIVETGPYAIVRHPTYTGALLTFVGLGFALGTWPGLVLTAVLTGIGYGYRIHVEERALRGHLDGYADYCERTPYRLVPGIY